MSVETPSRAGEEVTRLLREWQAGDDSALTRVLPLLYGDLRRLAQALMAGERPDHTLQATALVHEAFLSLARGRRPALDSRKHFVNTLARMMRRALIDHARARASAKRSGGTRVLMEAVPNEAVEESSPEAFLADAIAFDRAFEALAAMDERKARAVELRVFAGQSLRQTAELLDVSTATVIVDLRIARAWLARAMAEGVGGHG